MAFDLTFRFESSSLCDEMEDFSEGVELSVKRNDGDWIPLTFFASYSKREVPFIELSPFNDFTLRGYRVPYIIQNETITNYSIHICRNNNNNIFNDKLEFRWLQTSYQTDNSIQDIIILENIVVSAQNCSHSVASFPVTK